MKKNMEKKLLSNGLVIGIIILFVGASVIPSIGGKNEFQKSREMLMENQEPYHFSYIDRDSNLHMESDVDMLDHGDYISFNVDFPSSPMVVTSSIKANVPIIASPVNIGADGYTIKLIDHNGNPVDNAYVIWTATHPTELVRTDGFRLENDVDMLDDGDYISFNVDFPSSPMVVTSSIKANVPIIASPVNIGADGYTIKLIDHNGNPVDNAYVIWTATYPTEYVEAPPPEPDLDCEGELIWDGVEGGTSVNGNFTVENFGDPGTELDWEIIEWPEWGNWTFTPISGNELKPEDGKITVNVSVAAPKQITIPYKDRVDNEYIGEVKIINLENSSDFEIIPVYLKTPRNRLINTPFHWFYNFLQSHPNMFPIIRQLLGL